MTTFYTTLPANTQYLIDARLKGFPVLDVEVEGTGYDLIYNVDSLIVFPTEPRSVRPVAKNGRLNFSDVLDVDRQVTVIIKD